MRSNQCKQKIAEGQAAFGTMCNAASPLVAEFLGHSGYDFIVVDMQHGENNLENISVMMQALSATPATPVVRVPANVPMYIQRVLDLGAYGIIVPFVNTAKEAEDVVASVRYAPGGVRSWGPVRGSIYGGSDYFSKSADELLVLVMLESAEGLANAEAILSVPGVNGCFVGPADLNICLGYSPDSPGLGEKTEAGIVRISDIAKKVGKIAGIHGLNVDDARRRVEQGYQFVTVMADLRMMRVVASEALKALRA